MSHLDRFGRISRSIANVHGKAKPKNTKTVYIPEISDFLQFCYSLYGTKENPTHVTEERAYGFVSDTACRCKIISYGCTCVLPT